MKRFAPFLFFSVLWSSDPAKPDMLTPSILEVLEQDIIDNPVEPVVPRRRSTTPPPSPRVIKDPASIKEELPRIAVRRGCIIT